MMRTVPAVARAGDDVPARWWRYGREVAGATRWLAAACVRKRRTSIASSSTFQLLSPAFLCALRFDHSPPSQPHLRLRRRRLPDCIREAETPFQPYARLPVMPCRRDRMTSHRATSLLPRPLRSRLRLCWLCYYNNNKYWGHRPPGSKRLYTIHQPPHRMRLFSKHARHVRPCANSTCMSSMHKIDAGPCRIASQLNSSRVTHTNRHRLYPPVDCASVYVENVQRMTLLIRASLHRLSRPRGHVPPES